MHYRWSRIEKKHRINSHLIIHCPTSSGVSEMSERARKWAQRSARAKQARQSKRTSERCERMSKRTTEWPSTYIWVLGWSGPQCIVGSSGRVIQLRYWITSTYMESAELKESNLIGNRIVFGKMNFGWKMKNLMIRKEEVPREKKDIPFAVICNLVLVIINQCPNLISLDVINQESKSIVRARDGTDWDR